MNTVSLIGRLTSDIKIKNINESAEVSKFLLAVSRGYNDPDGNPITDFINCEIWNQSAKTLQKYTCKGSLLGIDGEIHTSKYNDNDGKTIYSTVIYVKKFTFLEPVSKKEEKSNNNKLKSDNSKFDSPANDENEENYIYFDNAEKYDQDDNDNYNYLDSNDLFR